MALKKCKNCASFHAEDRIRVGEQEVTLGACDYLLAPCYGETGACRWFSDSKTGETEWTRDSK